jgi:hypothetical protein
MWRTLEATVNETSDGPSAFANETDFILTFYARAKRIHFPVRGFRSVDEGARVRN